MLFEVPESLASVRRFLARYSMAAEFKGPLSLHSIRDIDNLNKAVPARHQEDAGFESLLSYWHQIQRHVAKFKEAEVEYIETSQLAIVGKESVRVRRGNNKTSFIFPFCPKTTGKGQFPSSKQSEIGIFLFEEI